ncbi:hypothetical protein [Streptomyces sp. NPDC057617]|uniref:hypothetical protein n=1 Tax=Streptomyces sp. NPDC057617 TaxID=3346184 RepID=UPI0036A17FEB
MNKANEPLALRKAQTGHTPSWQLTWHCAIRNTTSVELNDDASAVEPVGEAVTALGAVNHQLAFLARPNRHTTTPGYATPAKRPSTS